MRVQRCVWMVYWIMIGGLGGCDSDPGLATEALTQCAAASDCRAGLGCVCGLCTRDCTDDAVCGAFGAEARCLSASCGAEQVCGIPCTTSMECPSSLSCIGGQCAVPAPTADASVDRAVPDVMGDAMTDATVDAPDDGGYDGDGSAAVTGVTCEVRRIVPGGGCEHQVDLYRDVRFRFNGDWEEQVIESNMPGFIALTAGVPGEFYANADFTEYAGLIDTVLQRRGDVLTANFSTGRSGNLSQEQCDPPKNVVEVDCWGSTRLSSLGCTLVEVRDPSPLACEVTRRDDQCNVTSTSTDAPALVLSNGPHGPGTTLLADSPLMREAFSSSSAVAFTADLCGSKFARGIEGYLPLFVRVDGLRFEAVLEYEWGGRCRGGGTSRRERNEIRCAGITNASRP
ncbi:MAG: hypothetical protein AAGF12_08905 [Myxococcota bacterium]